MERYDPNLAPDPEAWQALEEQDRIALVADYHEQANETLDNPARDRLHAAMHCIVENQVVMGDETPVAATLDRLTDEGLTRHEALHAIAQTLTHRIHDAFNSDAPKESTPEEDESVGQDYFRALSKLSADDWREQTGVLGNKRNRSLKRRSTEKKRKR